MRLSYKKLSEADLASALASLKGWSLSDGTLRRVFDFGTYKEGLVFASTVGWVADNLNHHPDIHIGYAKVVVTTVTHDADGLTAYDFELARRIDSLVTAAGLADA